MFDGHTSVVPQGIPNHKNQASRERQQPPEEAERQDETRIWVDDRGNADTCEPSNNGQCSYQEKAGQFRPSTRDTPTQLRSGLHAGLKAGNEPFLRSQAS